MGSFRLDFLGVGPQCTGTTWLHRLLQYHPSLCLPKNVKETMFLDLYYEKGFSWYKAHFAHRRDGQLCGEIGPTYFDIEAIPARVRQLNPQCRIIINLRDPVSRALSAYRLRLSKGRLSGSFAEAVVKMPRIIDSGRYALHIPRWLETFGEDRVLLVLLDDIVSRPESVLKSIYDFLGVDEMPMPSEGYKKIGQTRMPRFRWLAKPAGQLVTWLRANRLHWIVELGKSLGFNKVFAGGERRMPGLTSSDRLWLLEEYEADIAFVEKLLGRDLSAWRRTE